MLALDLTALERTPLRREPFQFVIVPGFIKPEAMPGLVRDFPRITRSGSFPVSELAYGPAFGALLAELRGPEFETAISEKFAIQLATYPALITVRGRCHPQDGHIHTDAAWKIISVLLYLNPRWDDEGGRLRLLRSKNLEDVEAEAPPEWGTLIAFRRSDRSFHGHTPFEGERRVIQVNWVTSRKMVDREIARHRRTAWLKRWLPFVGGY